MHLAQGWGPSASAGDHIPLKKVITSQNFINTYIKCNVTIPMVYEPSLINPRILLKNFIVHMQYLLVYEQR